MQIAMPCDCVKNGSLCLINAVMRLWLRGIVTKSRQNSPNYRLQMSSNLQRCCSPQSGILFIFHTFLFKSNRNEDIICNGIDFPIKPWMTQIVQIFHCALFWWCEKCTQSSRPCLRGWFTAFTSLLILWAHPLLWYSQKTIINDNPRNVHCFLAFMTLAESKLSQAFFLK